MTGRTELVYLPDEIFKLVEKVREKFGMSRSGFYRHCIMTYLESKSLLSTFVKQESNKEKKRGSSN
ncbi:hypothetical protein A3K80_03880 [Candidatus Bathyarchaeota archaeon RBG_13_38_9]|nr:MAG: hypothetical protein A3K80_03880 [Candidatus Bathyarchaeota archaeon RBG_13_38_9]